MEQTPMEFDTTMNTTITSLYDTNFMLLQDEPFISTMTMLFTISTNINLETVVNKLEALYDCPLKLKTSKTTKSFLNCVFLSYDTQQKHKATIKLFRNGSIHITGCKRCAEANDIALLICNRLLTSDAYIVKWTIQLINVIVRLVSPLDIRKSFQLLQNKIKDRTDIHCVYDKDHHPGLNFKIDRPILLPNKKSSKTITAMVFKSGTVIMSGIKKVDELEHASKIIFDLIEEELDSIKSDTPTAPLEPVTPKKRGRKRKIDTDMFYQSMIQQIG